MSIGFGISPFSFLPAIVQKIPFVALESIVGKHHNVSLS